VAGALVISILALLISSGSFGVALFNALRDRARLKITCTFWEGARVINVKMVNAGRRPVILRLLGFTTKDGNWTAEILDGVKGGIRLGEHEVYERRLTWDDTVHMGPDDKEPIYADVFWVEDSLGVRHEIPGSRDYLKKM
jgi:hypothetical protein